MSRHLFQSIALVLLLLAVSGRCLKEKLSIERSKVDGTFQRVSATSQTYAEYSIDFDVPISLAEDVSGPKVNIWIVSQEGHSGYDTPLPFGSAVLLAIKDIAHDSQSRTAEFTRYICEVLKAVFSAEDNVWMEGCVPSISAAAAVSSRVLSEIPFVNITMKEEFTSPVFGHTDSSLLRVRDWAYLGLRIPPSAFFHPDSMRKSLLDTPFEASPASKTVADRRRAWNVPNVELDSPLLRRWKIEVDANIIKIKYVEHAHIRSAGNNEWLVARPPAQSGIESELAAAVPHKDIELDADSHVSVTADCVRRRLEGEGFHRTLTTTIQLSSKSSLSHCKIIVAELFDQGIYVDRYEIDNQHRWGAIPNWATVFSEIDLEKPAYESTQNFIFVHARADENNQVNVTVPIHFRYQAPSWSRAYEPVPVVPSEIYIQCSPQQPWLHVTHWGKTGHDTCEVLTAYIPIGDLSLETYIKWGTLVFTALGAFALVVYVTDCFSPLSDPDQSKDKRRKPKDE